MAPERVSWYQECFERITAHVQTVVLGKSDVVRLAVACLVAEGHLLIEDVPGTGKTTLAKALARSIDAPFARIQFTPDLLPSDVTGVSIWNQRTMEFEFRHGPVFSNIVLADEINRASPKTQSALLEVMEERAVTTDSVTRPVHRPFIVIATQNPIDMDGTYRLPEAQLDRFMIRSSLGYPSADAEADILGSKQQGTPVDELQPIISPGDVESMIHVALGVHVADPIKRYIVSLAASTRSAPQLRLGASTRASVALLRASCAVAASEGRHYVLPEDVQALARPVLEHRLLLSSEAQLAAVTVSQVMDTVLEKTPVPVVVHKS